MALAIRVSRNAPGFLVLRAIAMRELLGTSEERARLGSIHFGLVQGGHPNAIFGRRDFLAVVAPMIHQIDSVRAKAHFIENTQRLGGSPHEPGTLT